MGLLFGPSVLGSYRRRKREAWRIQKGSDDKGACTVHKLNDAMECWEVEQEIVDRMLLVVRWGSLE